MHLVVLAAGMGSRYGGLKQIDPMGPSGETVMDYSVYDAIRAGFERIVFVIRKDFEDAFRERITCSVASKVDVRYAFQELDDLPTGVTAPAGRSKPWGTAHAVRAARHEVDGPFAVINADDFYGADAFRQLASFFQRADGGLQNGAMVGFQLGETLSEYGTVSRGICRTDEEGFLREVSEATDIQASEDSSVSGKGPDGSPLKLSTNTLVSMNFWGFQPEIFKVMESVFSEFLAGQGDTLDSEWYLPDLVTGLIDSREGRFKVLPAEGQWFGVTYPEDKGKVVAAIQSLVESGTYPRKLVP